MGIFGMNTVSWLQIVSTHLVFALLIKWTLRFLAYFFAYLSDAFVDLIISTFNIDRERWNGVLYTSSMVRSSSNNERSNKRFGISARVQSQKIRPWRS